MTRKIKMLLALLIVSSVSLWAAVTIKNVSVTPRWPWNGLVDITYTVECDDKDEYIYISLSGHDNERDAHVPMLTLTGDGAKEPVKAGGPYRLVWNSSADRADFSAKSFSLAVRGCEASQRTYLVVDLYDGPNAKAYPYRYSSAAPDTSKDDCRTTELWFRLIPKGTFMMGDENGTQHEVTLTQDFYIGVFEVTQKQYELVTGSNPSGYKGDCRPVECVSCDTIRGSGWPSNGYKAGSNTFMGKLQAKTGLTIDLPTESQWEYACRKRADGSYWYTSYNSGKDNLAELGRYDGNRGDGKGGYGEHTKVGSYLPSELGLYDMHGNVWEWCLDWYGDYPTAAEDPKGASGGSYRVRRGGSWNNFAINCRAADRYCYYPNNSNNNYGFRAACLPVQ